MKTSEAVPTFESLPEGLTNASARELCGQIRSVQIIKTLWYPELISEMEKSARGFFAKWDISPEKVHVSSVPGAFELPLGVMQSIDLKPAPDLVVVLGCVIQGDTPHFDFVCQGLTFGLMKIQIKKKLPMGFGVLTVNNLDQAKQRHGKGAEAAQAALFMFLRSRNLEGER